jgi:hypothetical protein
VSASIIFYARLGVGVSTKWDDPYQTFRQVGAGPGARQELLGPDGEWRPTDMMARVRRPPLHDLGEVINMTARIRHRRTVTELISEYARVQGVAGDSPTGRLI